MGAHKISKVAKKPTKLDSLKNLVFGNPGSSKKSNHSSVKDAGPKKEVTATKTSVTGKSQLAVSIKSAGKNKSSTEAESHKSKHVHSKKASTKSASHKSSSRGSGSSEGLGEAVCREVACEGLATSGGYCRLHYIKNWKKIKRKEAILHEKKLDQYIEELVAKYPDKYIEAIRQDLTNDKDFAKVIHDLDLDEGVDDFDGEGGESMDSLIDTIKRDFDDDSDAF